MKTILVNGRFLTQRVTGVQRFARGLLGALAGRLAPTSRPAGAGGAGDIRFVVAVPRGELVEPLPALDVLRDDFPLSSHPWEQARLPVIFRKSGADLLWSPCNTGPVAVARQVVTIHDAAVFAGPEWFSPAFGKGYRALHKVLGRRCRLILTDSVFSRGELARFGVAPENKILVVPGGVSLPPVGPGGGGTGGQGRAAGIGGVVSVGKAARPAGSYLLALGSRDPRKDVKTMLRAWTLLAGELKAGRTLVVAGGGAASFAGESLGAVPEGVSFPGYVPDEELPALYAGAEAFIASSVYEGYSLPSLEAMAAGAPVLASDIPTHKEVCGDAAAYFKVGDAEQLAEEITALFYNPERRAELSDAGRRRAAGLSWDAAADALLQALGGVL